ncbi:(R)-citramalate synthase [Methanobrevibacter curvatus]|uniref:Putative (R)-citramalate synthase CimA n=1 Tax=Methanobrevibacter curvatus TaxID=49547 RepID=A0A165ZUR6_9EURY|nr:(R)-citramalate synthase [Methanobrevibacter curvatus]KZX11189.1 2-isopropylmalate synthase [Methanobrevibacter curvatus]
MKINVLDTTLRDGEQTPGVSLTKSEKLRIASKLDEIGVNIIEAGSAITSAGERESIKAISKEGLNAEICSFARSVKVDIDMALECDVGSVHLVVPTSDLHIKEKLNTTREKLLSQAVESTEYALDHGLIVEVSAEDGTRSDIDFLKKVFTETIAVGAQRICACDTVGILTPEKSYEFYSQLKDLPVPLSVHCHNDFGLAVSNTLSAIRAGAKQFHGTINGIGERAGNAAIEEVILSLNSLYTDYETDVKIDKLYESSKLVARLTGVYLQPNKAIVGENAFAHESGIHTDGIIKNASTYESITPEILGRKRKFVLGKHIGSKGLKKRLDDLKLNYNDDQFVEIFKKIKYLGDLGKCLSDVDLEVIAEEILDIQTETRIKLEELSIVSGNKVIPTASIKLKIDDKDILEAGIGVGPVDAAINAVKKGIKDFADVKLEEYHVDAITGGTDALIDVILKLKSKDKIISARGTQPDIINASVEAYLSGVNRLLENQ